MDEFILQAVNVNNNSSQDPDENIHYKSFISRFSFESYLSMNFPGLLNFSNSNPLDNIDRDDLARSVIRTLLNSQHNMSGYIQNI